MFKESRANNMQLTQNVSFCKPRTFELVNIPPSRFKYTAPLSDPGELGGGDGGARQQARWSHLLAHTEAERDKRGPIPVFVPVAGQIPRSRLLEGADVKGAHLVKRLPE